MSDKLPRVTAEQITKILKKHGFGLARQSGSHQIFKNAAGNRATIPYHSGKILHPKILKNIIADADLDIETIRNEL